jgi:DNA-binding NarL/FixJ family response regulator
VRVDEIRVLLVDDHAGLRAELRRLIEGQPDLRLVAEASGAREAVHLALTEALTVVVMDMSLPDGDGITATAEILQQRPELRVLGLSRHEDGGHVQQMLAVGARGYVFKHNAADGLLTAIRTVAAGGTYIDPAFGSKQQEPKPPHRDTPREAVRVRADMSSELTAEEQAVLKQVAAGYSNGEIAQQLDLLVPAVAEHKARAMQKLDLRTRIDVVRYVQAQGWKSTDPSAT